MDEGGGQEGRQDVPQAAAAAEEELLLLHDYEHYVRSRGIAPADPAAVVRAGEAELAERLRAGEVYQEAAHREAFRAADERERAKEEERREVLAGLEEEGAAFAVLAGSSGREIPGVPARPLVAWCDTVYAMVRWRVAAEESGGGAPFRRVLDLHQFAAGAVGTMVLVLVPALEAAGGADLANLLPPLLPEHQVVDLCRLAHYLQCSPILDATVAVLAGAVDLDNCLSLCQMADQLSLPVLFEAAVSRAIGSLDEIEGSEVWEEDLPTPLKHLILTLRNAAHSSIVGRGRQLTEAFFSSREEFMAIFSDSIREKKERLAEARRRQDEVVRERLGRGGRHRDPYGGSVGDAAAKIERQARRIETLEGFYRDQKKIFSSAGDGGQVGEPFRLGVAR
jgi:hypothetical protein